MATTTQSNTDIVLDAVGHLQRRDAQGMRAFFTPETVERFPGVVCHGPDEIAAYFQEVFDALPDFRLEVQATAEQGDAVFLRWVITGTHGGAAFQGIAATGKAIRLDGIDHFTVRDGKIVSNVVVFDQMDFGRQLGLLPPDGSPADKALKVAFNGVTALRRRVAARRGA